MIKTSVRGATPDSAKDGHGPTHYARIESLPATPDDENDVHSRRSTVVRFGAIRADWVGFSGGPFDLASNNTANPDEETPADRYWLRRIEQGPHLASPDPFQDMPTERLQFLVTQADAADMDLTELMAEGTWLELNVSPTDRSAPESWSIETQESLGIVIPDEPSVGNSGVDEVAVVVTLSEPLQISDVGVSLSRSLSMAAWPLATPRALTEAMSSIDPLSQMVALNVGQATSVALLDSEGYAQAYVDVGTPLAFLHGKAPAGLGYCLCRNPLIILTHWHADHYQGGWAQDRTLLQLTWIAPKQPAMTVNALRYASSILAAGGSILLVDPTTPGPLIARLVEPREHVDRAWPRHGQEAQLVVATGRTLNDSGLALYIHDIDREASWLLPGDANYAVIPRPSRPYELTALVVAHHGGALSSAPAARTTRRYARVLYSFGRLNTYGHANAKTSATHARSNWRDRATTVLGGHNQPRGLDVLTTGFHFAGQDEPVTAGWLRRPLTPEHFVRCSNINPPRR